MKAFNKTLLYWILTILLVIGVMSYGTYLIRNRYIVECFTSLDTGSPDTSHNVDQPINTTTSCKNVCGPLARCSITGEQCTSDVDCFGCIPKMNKIPNYGRNVGGQNDAGKLTSGVTPTYSVLTTDIGTQAAIVKDGVQLEKPPQYNQGVDLWRTRFDDGYKLFNLRYKPPKDLKYEPTYPARLTMSGEFTDGGPLASNAYLS
jgi:hypothetical protein